MERKNIKYKYIYCILYKYSIIQVIQYQSKVWTHLSFLGEVFSLLLLFSTLKINTEYILTMKEHIWNDVLNKKSVIYHVENNKSKEKTSQKMRRCVQTFDWYCIYIYI